VGPVCRRDNRQNTARQLAAITIIALLSSNANATDFPNILGSWKVPDKEHSATPYQQPQAASLAVKIARQDGESFSGTVINLNGRTEQIIGAFRRDARTFVYSSQRTAGTGKVQDHRMEICRTDARCALLVQAK
jgi:hypothetical protein